MKSNQKGFGVVEILIVIFVAGLIGTTGWYLYDKKQDETSQPQSSTTSTPATAEEPEKVDYGTLLIKETGISFELSESIKDAYYVANKESAGASFGVRSLDTISNCKALDRVSAFTGVAILFYGGGGEADYQSFKNSPNSSQVADKFFFEIGADVGCRSNDPATQQKIQTIQDAFEKAGKSITIKDFSNSLYNQ